MANRCVADCSNSNYTPKSMCMQFSFCVHSFKLPLQNRNISCLNLSSRDEFNVSVPFLNREQSFKSC